MAWEPATPEPPRGEVDLQKPTPAERAGWDDYPGEESRRPLAVRAWADLSDGWRFAQERPASLVEHIAMARRGEWTTELDGWRRQLAVTWVYVVAVPVAVLAHLAIWQTSRMTRCLSMLAVELLVTTALNRMPLFAWLLPDWTDLAAWWPLNLL